MSTSISSAERLKQLKREAKQLQKANPGMKHHEALNTVALNTVARDYGYLDYRHARAELAPDDEEECT